MSEDPIGFEGGDVNLYRYVLNNPVYSRDPHGKWPEWLDDGVCFITGRCNPTDIDSPDWGDTLEDLIDDMFGRKKEKDSSNTSNSTFLPRISLPPLVSPPSSSDSGYMCQ